MDMLSWSDKMQLLCCLKNLFTAFGNEPCFLILLLQAEWSAGEFRKPVPLLCSTETIPYLFRALAPICRMGVITSNLYLYHEALKK